jgi:hypothetical protein
LQLNFDPDPVAIERWKREILSTIVIWVEVGVTEILFWDESVFRADTEHGKSQEIRYDSRRSSTRTSTPASAVTVNGCFD